MIWLICAVFVLYMDVSVHIIAFNVLKGKVILWCAWWWHESPLLLSLLCCSQVILWYVCQCFIRIWDCDGDLGLYIILFLSTIRLHSMSSCLCLGTMDKEQSFFPFLNLEYRNFKMSSSWEIHRNGIAGSNSMCFLYFDWLPRGLPTYTPTGNEWQCSLSHNVVCHRVFGLC